MSHVVDPSRTVPEYGRPVPRRRWTPVRLLAWTVGVVAAFGLLGSILLPNLCRAREPANRAKCASNLHQIGLGILLYQQDNGQAYPDTLGRLVLTEQIGADVFVCPASADEKSPATQPAEMAADVDGGAAKHHCSYVYLGRGLSGNVPATMPIVYERLDDHDDDGCNVLFGDGHAEWLTRDGAAAVLPAGAVPPRMGGQPDAASKASAEKAAPPAGPTTRAAE